MWTLLGITLLLVFYLAIGVYVTAKVASARNEEPGTYLGNENTWFYMLAVATILTFVVALFNWGPAVLLPESFPSPEQRAGLKNILNHLWSKEPPVPVELPIDQLPWTRGTWFWWKATGLYFVLTAVFGCYAWSDEVVAWIRGLRASYLRRKRRQQSQGGGGTSHFFLPDLWDIFSFVEWLNRGLRRPRS